MLFKEDTVARSQHEAVRTNAGWFRWKHDLVEITGTDATEFLDYLFVNSIAKTPVGRSKYTTMLDENGGIIDDVIVMHIEEGLWWVSTLYAPELVAWIESHKNDRSIHYRDITAETDMFSIQGPNSRSLMNMVLSESVDDLKYFGIKEASVNGTPVRIHRSGFTGELGYEIYCAEADSSAVRTALAKAAHEIGATEITVLEVYVRGLSGEKGYPLRQDLLGLTPFEADMDWSVDMDKDFIGKKALETAQDTGRKRQLVGLEYTEPYNDICQGEAVRIGGIKVGEVTASMYGYTIGKNIGYAVVDRTRVPIGCNVTIGCHNTPAKVVERIWYDPEGARARV